MKVLMVAVSLSWANQQDFWGLDKNLRHLKTLSFIPTILGIDQKWSI